MISPSASTKTPLRIAVLLSGRGSNFTTLVKNCQGVDFIGVISDQASAGGLEHAKNFGIPTSVFDRAQFSTKKEQKAAILAATLALQPDLVCLCGFMQIVAPEFIAAFPNRIINIHPSLLPELPGLDTHARAIAAGANEHGCTVHMVDAGVDTGAIIAQARCPVLTDDTPERLAARVLEQEHRIYPWVVSRIASREIVLASSGPEYSEVIEKDAAQLGFLLGAKQTSS